MFLNYEWRIKLWVIKQITTFQSHITSHLRSLVGSHVGSTLAPCWLHVGKKGGRQHFLLFLNITLRFRFRCISMQPGESIVVYWLMIPRLELCHGGPTYHTTISSAEDSMERTRRLYRHIYICTLTSKLFIKQAFYYIILTTGLYNVLVLCV